MRFLSGMKYHPFIFSIIFLHDWVFVNRLKLYDGYHDGYILLGVQKILKWYSLYYYAIFEYNNSPSSSKTIPILYSNSNPTVNILASHQKIFASFWCLYLHTLCCMRHDTKNTTKNSEEIDFSGFQVGEEIRIFGQNIDRCWAWHIFEVIIHPKFSKYSILEFCSYIK